VPSARFFAALGAVFVVVCLTPAPSQAQSLAPTLLSPLNGAVTESVLLQPFNWNAVANAQAYYLYVGTTAGARDVVDTGGLQSTSYLAAGLPVGPTLYARIWAEVGGIWRFTDSTFRLSPSKGPTLTYPAGGAIGADMTRSMTWTTVTAAQAYYLYVGTTVGAKNLVDSGGLQTTSYLARGLPSGQTLYARVWAETSGEWHYTDSTFVAAASPPSTATMTYPVNGAVNADLSLPVRWTAVPNAQSYYLYIGSTPGAKNLVDSGGLQSTSYQPRPLPAGQTLYARLWTQLDNVWRFTDSTFTAAVSLAPMLTYPADGAVAADMTQPIAWTAVPNAHSYYLYIGTTPGAKDLIDSGGLQTTTFLARGLPSGRTLRARIWAEVDGIWRYSDSSFTAAPSAPPAPVLATITSPANGVRNADSSLPIQWTTVADAQWYYLYVGSTPGAKDILDSGGLHTTTISASHLPVGRLLYARLWTAVGGVWRYVDSTFAFAPSSKLLYAPDLVYQGSFRVPSNEAGNGYTYGGTAMSFNPLAGSLFLAGFTLDNKVGEITIPAIGGTAARLQPLTEPTNALIDAINPGDDNQKLIGGTLVYDGQLIVSGYSYYDANESQLLSHFVRPLDLSNPSVTGPLRVGPLNAGFYSGYMALTPPEWQTALGAPALTGNADLAVIGRTSSGPSVAAFDPSHIDAHATELVGYPFGHQTLGAWDQANAIYGGADSVKGVVFPVGTSTVLFFGMHGTTFCYGPGTSDPLLAGTSAADIGDTVDNYCYDPSVSAKGQHGYPYYSYVWAYDAHALAAVKAGLRSPWSVTPYAVWTLPVGPSIGGAAYDPITGRIFVSEMGAGVNALPLIHVFNVQ